MEADMFKPESREDRPVTIGLSSEENSHSDGRSFQLISLLFF